MPIGGNLSHEDRENAVGLKTIRDVVVSQNTMYGYRSPQTSSGDAVVVGSNGYDPQQGLRVASLQRHPGEPDGNSRGRSAPWLDHRQLHSRRPRQRTIVDYHYRNFLPIATGLFAVL